ncbi:MULTISPECIES: tetratricopeptide repeat-containing sensor histidine kinase [unclassified Cellulophaga]|uniref:tetratricopeptide repeat-containing sensor histidine kinase n=1 Tax=unclassified Cellulophaga TaxID=2634405 RepID=UPI000C2CAD88|nr:MULTISPECIES: ATP-binding protein [unclassified Cellulophaga]MDO6490934.1 ATP-binding protein [Cellulophaga sp. 2_MG-2023]MDO6493872.1 ATP-binding protein [Cellulophaga sp. 3_MG-2023]PKB44120.1 histidine kinase/DNA gyrase B/HSP90-like ATPase [Cellulophaga sp. RHA19]
MVIKSQYKVYCLNIRRPYYLLSLLCTLLFCCITKANGVNTPTISSDLVKKDTIYVNALINKAERLRFYNSDSLLILANESLKLSEELEYSYGISNALLQTANYYSDAGNSEKANTLYIKALEESKKTTDSNLQLSIMNNFAKSYYYFGNYANSLAIYLEGVELAEKSNNNRMLSVMNENIANLYSAQKDYKQALLFLEKSIKLNLIIKDDFYSAKTLCNYAYLQSEIGNINNAMFNINKSISIFEEYNNIRWIAKAYRVKGDIYLKQKKYTWAIRWYDQSFHLYDQIKNNRDKLNLLSGLAYAHFGNKNTDTAELYALTAYNNAKELNSIKNIESASDILYKINKNKKDFEKSLFFHELYKKVTDSLSRKENKRSLLMLQTKIERDKLKETKEVVDKLENARIRSAIYIGISILIIWGIITYMMSKSRKAHKKLNTELQLKQVVLENREEELQEINETKDKLFSIIAHDLRGPIGALLDVLKMMKSGDLAITEFRDFVPKLIKDVDHISFTLNNLLSWGQTQMNGATTNTTLAELNTLAENNINLLGETAKKKSITLVNEIPENTMIFSDPNQIDIVIRNIISNALKFTPKGGKITIDAQEKYQFIEVTIKDTGIGMSEEDLSKVFTPNQSHTTFGTDNEKGTGLGISLSKEMVENNGGNLWAKSKLGKGTIFYFTVPKGEDNYQYTL